VDPSWRTAALPAGLTHRPPVPADAALILPLVVACDVRVLDRSDATLSQVRSDLATPAADNERGGRLVQDASGAAVGWLWTEVRTAASEAFVDLYALDDAVLSWLLGQAFDFLDLLATEWGRPVRVAAGSYQHDGEYGAALRSAGFEVVRSFWHMRRSLDGVSPEPSAPAAGVSVRLADATDEADRRLLHRVHDEAFADHWHHTSLPFEDWYARLDASAGRNVDQWWVAEVDGEPAGLLIGADALAELGEGYVDILGVLRAHRGRGVAKTLLANAFADAVRRGRSHIMLGVDSESPTGATRLYESVGMSVDKVLLAWERQVAPSGSFAPGAVGP
jgi:mycothiol synthase